MSTNSGSKPGTRSSKAKPVDPADKLFKDKFARRAQYNGDADSKKLAAPARRLATGLRNAKVEYSDFLQPEQLKVLGAAAAVMTELAKDADRVSVMSRKAKVDHDEQQLRAREANADAVSAELWGTEATLDRARFFSDCRDLVQFIDLSHGQGGSHEWMKRNIPTRTPGIDDVAGGYSGQHLLRLLEAYEKKPTPDILTRLRRRAAEYMDAIRQSRPDRWHRNATLDDFEAWKASRVQFKVPG